MKIFMTLFLFYLSNCSYSQELDIFQNDTVYAENKITKRTMYLLQDNKRQKELMTYYNSKGEKTTQYWYWNGDKDFHNVETFNYSTDGSLHSIVDSFADGGVETTYLYYEDAILRWQVTLNQKKDTSNFRTFPNRNTTIQKWYSNGIPYRSDTTIFEKENVKIEYYGVDNSDHNRWHYRFSNSFDKNGNVLEISSKVEGPYTSTQRYVYDEKNLLVRKQEYFGQNNKLGKPLEHIFEYE